MILHLFKKDFVVVRKLPIFVKQNDKKMTKAQIIEELKVTSPKYKNVTASYLMKYKKAELLEMLQNKDVIETPKQTVIEEKPNLPKLSPEEERLNLIHILTKMYEASLKKDPKSVSDFDWRFYGDNNGLKIEIKMWKHKLKTKGFDSDDIKKIMDETLES
jgi:hypothetical protein